MLEVKSPDEALKLINGEFSALCSTEGVTLANALGRVLACDVCASEFVPSFNRSTVDGYAVRAEDTFGCSGSIPAVLRLCGRVEMGRSAEVTVKAGECCEIPTGGELPSGADCAVMLEYTEVYGDGTVGVLKSAAPGNNVIFRGDDVFPGKTVLHSGHKITSQDIGALAAMGVTEVEVRKKPVIGIISTGDELVPAENVPEIGQIRDVNSLMLSALAQEFSSIPVFYGIIKDDEASIANAVDTALAECDAVLISGGSSVGEKDATCRIIAQRTHLLFHGLAVKPGKPTILGKAGNKPVFGLPGNPAAAFFVARIFVREAIERLSGASVATHTVKAYIDERVGSNHGRAEYIPVCLYKSGGVLKAHPLRNKSGLISTLAQADGFFCIPDDSEGVSEDTELTVTVR